MFLNLISPFGSIMAGMAGVCLLGYFTKPSDNNLKSCYENTYKKFMEGDDVNEEKENKQVTDTMNAVLYLLGTSSGAPQFTDYGFFKLARSLLLVGSVPRKFTFIGIFGKWYHLRTTELK